MVASLFQVSLPMLAGRALNSQTPLLQQGLSDAEEFVIVKALNALTCMCQLGLLQKPHVYEFASDIGKFFVFLKIRMGNLGFPGGSHDKESACTVQEA